jgi:hypothetical protein
VRHLVKVVHALKKLGYLLGRYGVIAHANSDRARFADPRPRSG